MDFDETCCDWSPSEHLPYLPLRKNTTTHQVTTMLATSKNVVLVFPGHNHLLTTGTDDPDTLIIAWAPARVMIKVSGHQYRWLAGGYDRDSGWFCAVS